jgi:hypothetical protein
MKNNNKKYIEYNLHNSSTYNDELNYEVITLFNDYTSIIFNYLKYISENTYLLNRTNYKYIINKGIDSFSHIYKIILLYTKNNNLSNFHTQKAYYFYIEFIEQINQDNNMFLKLNSKDAILFLYKKTIFDLDDNFIKTKHKLNLSENKILELFSCYINIFNSFITFFIIQDTNKYIFNNFNLFEEYYNKIINNIKNIKYKYDYSTLNILSLFLNKLISANININNVSSLIELFINHINNKIDLNKLEYKINIIHIDTDIKNNNIYKLEDLLDM